VVHRDVYRYRPVLDRSGIQGVRDVSPYLHGIPANMLQVYLAPGWDSMTMNDKIVWLLKRARARAEELEQPDLEWVSINTFLALKLYTYRNRISEMRPGLHEQGVDIVADTVQAGDRKVWAYRIQEYSGQRELPL
jgi:hypothetical protein